MESTEQFSKLASEGGHGCHWLKSPTPEPLNLTVTGGGSMEAAE